MIIANFKLMSNTAILPSFGGDDEDNAGIDFYSDIDCIIPAQSNAIVSSGVAWYPEIYINPKDITSDSKMYDYIQQIKKNNKIVMYIWPRSGLSFKSNIENGAGLIDQNFRGEFKFHLYNFGSSDYKIKCGDRVAQGVIDLIPRVTIKKTDTLPDSNRGSSGFGSTGK